MELTTERKLFMVPVETRDTATLRTIIFNHVQQGSIIHTDLWKGYTFIDDCTFYDHSTIVHSLEFNNSVTDVDTNYVEGTNAGLKRRIPVRSRVRNGIEEHLKEFVWRRKHEHDDLWEQFITDLVEIEYD